MRKYKYSFLSENVEGKSCDSVKELIISLCDSLNINLSEMDAVDTHKLYVPKVIYRLEYTTIGGIEYHTATSIAHSGILLDIMKKLRIPYSTKAYSKTDNYKVYADFIYTFNKFKEKIKSFDSILSVNVSECSKFIQGISFMAPDALTISYKSKFSGIISNTMNDLESALDKIMPAGYVVKMKEMLDTSHDTILNVFSIGLDKDELSDSEKTKYVKDYPGNPYLEYINESSTIPKLDNLLASFDVKIDNSGDVIITQKEFDSFDEHFKNSHRLLKSYSKSKNYTGMKNEICKLHYMSKVIERYHLKPVKDGEQRKKQMKLLDLRSVMINTFNYYLQEIIENDQDFDFQSYFDNSKYGKTYKINVEGVGKFAKKVVKIFL